MRGRRDGLRSGEFNEYFLRLTVEAVSLVRRGRRVSAQLRGG